MSEIEITVIRSANGPLTKRISIAGGKVKSDGSACRMVAGTARRVPLDSPTSLAELLENMPAEEAIALGRLRQGLAGKVEVVLKRQLKESTSLNIIARTAEYLSYAPGEPALMLLDHDAKGMPVEIAAKVKEAGGFSRTVVAVIPVLRDAARVRRRSTSAGLYNRRTRKWLANSASEHTYIAVQDGTDIERALKTLHSRLWLAGYGYFVISAAGQLLDRSIIDASVYGAERLVFEGAPVLVAPVGQSQKARRPKAADGVVVETIAALPPLTITETATLRELKARQKQALAAKAAKVRAAYVAKRAKQLAERTGITPQAAAQIVSRQCEGILLPPIVLPFDDPHLAGVTVAKVLADPARYEGETLADPLEGVGYGRCKAVIMLNGDGTPWIHSFAHGRSIYHLRYDAAAVRAVLKRTPDANLLEVLVKLDGQAEINDVQLEKLVQYLSKRTGHGVRVITRGVQEARKQRRARQAEEARERRLGQRKDPRPQLPCPAHDSPWLPVMQAINQVIAAAPRPQQTRRNIEGSASRCRRIAVPNTHAFTSEESETTLPTPEQWAIVQMSEIELAEEIEKFIEYADETGRPVHLPTQFVRHYLRRDDGVLPTVVAIATLPMILADRGVLALDNDIDPERGIEFRIPKQVLTLLPNYKECGPKALKEAMRFLSDDWLCDVLTDYEGKCIIIAGVLTIIQRSLLPDRPVFFVTSGRRGAGKTTLIIMLIMAVTGVSPAASAWSSNEDERRKALLSYFMHGVPYILWDNIPRGTQITCPHIEKSCTTAYYADRKLGVSQMVAAAASTIHLFTGNNIGPRGDLASRSLHIRLEVDRTDPENRSFRHPDPIGWTTKHRAKILRALYTILIGNPTLDQPHDAQMKTRFKMWYRLIGSAVEHAAKQAGEEIDFQNLFRNFEEEDVEETSLAQVLSLMLRIWPKRFNAQGLCKLINDDNGDAAALLRDFFCRSSREEKASAKSIGWKLKQHLGEPVSHGERTLVLKSQDGRNGKIYWVEESFPSEE